MQKKSARNITPKRNRTIINSPRNGSLPRSYRNSQILPKNPINDKSSSAALAKISPYASPRGRKSIIRNKFCSPLIAALNTSDMKLKTSINGNISSRECTQETRKSSEPPTPQQEFESLQLPITPGTALSKFQKYLTPYEQAEILSYKKIYFLGLGAKKISNINLKNYGYDDERGDYNLIIGDHIDYRYEIISIIGKGSFGQVCKCFDRKKHSLIAMKIIRNKKKFLYQAGIEIKVLSIISSTDKQDSANLVHMYDNFTFRKHICLTFELLSINLYELIKNNNFKGLPLNLVRRIAIQLLYSLQFLKKKNIIHCDLKPENILLKHLNKSGIKIIDFGSACLEDECVYTYIQSRFYRAPEIILGIPYTTAIDIWSFGCILVELANAYPLFPAENEADLMTRIMEIKGLPPDNLIEKSTRANLFFSEELIPLSLPSPKGRNRIPGSKLLTDFFPCGDKLLLDLIERCLEWDPAKRITPEQALNHAWILDISLKAEVKTSYIKHSRRLSLQKPNLPSLNHSLRL
ncbi:DYRK3_4 [Blepharisma stoltei]|uniref:dual-specificity kinase n=1 Tax=Blepharisma stoltei TaxID=1481888 RepID=A0AAU9IN11_9CILI|nr:unnamed protein product [Blepharisma stoltei]